MIGGAGRGEKRDKERMDALRCLQKAAVKESISFSALPVGQHGRRNTRKTVHKQERDGLPVILPDPLVKLQGAIHPHTHLL